MSDMPYDVIVIGGSFAGQGAAMMLARARRRILVIDSGLPRNRFAHSSHAFLGQDGRKPYDILAEAGRQLRAYPTVGWIDGEATAARKDEDLFVVTLADGREERAKRLILATGVKDELPPIAGMQERWGVTVLHCPYCHGYEVAGNDLGVVATGPKSMHQALLIPDWGPTTYFTQGAFEPNAEELDRLADRGVRIVRSPIVELLGPTPQLEGVRLADGRVLPVAALFVGPKTSMSSPIAEQLGCGFEEGNTGPDLLLGDKKCTTVEGVYAAGDATTSTHNATLAAASGVLAGVAVHQSLALH
jgi:thioredoxin reductase